MNTGMVLKPNDDFVHITDSDDDKNSKIKLEQMVGTNDSGNALIVDPIT